MELDYYNQKIRQLGDEITRYKEYSKQLNNQSLILKEEELLAIKQYKRDSSLFFQGVIPEADYEKSRTAALQKRYAYEQSRITLASNEIQISGISREILDMRLKASEDEGKMQSALMEAANNLSANIADWEQKYILKSTVEGVVSFTRIRSRNQEVREGDLVMSVVPENQGLVIAKVNLPLSGAGKVRNGQKVNIKFSNYPYLEYGMVSGIIRSISNVAGDNNEYSVVVDLPDGLKTGYNTELPFTQDMQGIAEIITNERRLLERIVLPLKAVLARQRQIKN
jgi:HlyD family secretion protein